MYELNEQEIDMVAGAGLLDGLANLVGSATSLILTPVAGTYNGAASLLNGTSSGLATGGLLGGALGVVTGAVSGIGSILSTGGAGLGQVPNGAAGATNVTNAFSLANLLNSITAPTLNLINIPN